MIPDRPPTRDRDPENTAERAQSDGGDEVGFDEGAMYVVVRKAVEDAILGVIGTLLLVGVAFALGWIGIAIAGGAESPHGTAVGVIVGLIGIYIGAATLGIIPPLGEWF